MENTTAVYTSFFRASLNIWNISTSHSLISSSVNRCFQFHLYHRVIKQILFFIFPNSCIAAVYLLLMSQLSQLPRTLRGIHLYWGSRQHTITSASRYQITRDLFFLKRLGRLLHEMNCFTVSQDDTQLGTSLLLFRSFCKCYLFSTGEHL